MHTTTPRLRAAIASLCAAGLLCATAAQAGEEQKARKPHKAHKPAKVRVEKSSAETAAERDRRLQRECKGRPNAGACLGYGG